jgi:hypothetical protein
MALMDFLGGNFFGQTGYGDLMDEEQKKRMQQQALMSMGAQLLQSSGPSRTRTNLGQSLGQAYLTGQQAYNQAGQNALTGMLTKQKIDEYKRERGMDQLWKNVLLGGAGGATAQQAQQAPQMPQRQPGMPPLQGVMAMPPAQQTGMPQQPGAGGIFQGITPQQRMLLAGMDRKDAQKAMFDLAARQDPEMIRTMRALGLAPTPENYERLKRASAPSMTSKVVMPAGQTSGREAVDKAYAADYLQWTQGGGADALGNLAQVGTVLQQLEMGKPLTGPMIGIQPDFILALSNPNAADAKQRIEDVVQRNLRIVLGAQFTEKEGERLISRAYNPSLSPQQNASRLRKLFEQMSVAAQARQQMASYFEQSGTLTGYEGPRPNINQFYQALEVRSPPKAGDVVDGPNGQKFKFLGGDPNKQESWEVM